MHLLLTTVYFVGPVFTVERFIARVPRVDARGVVQTAELAEARHFRRRLDRSLLRSIPRLFPGFKLLGNCNGE